MDKNKPSLIFEVVFPARPPLFHRGFCLLLGFLCKDRRCLGKYLLLQLISLASLAVHDTFGWLRLLEPLFKSMRFVRWALMKVGKEDRRPTGRLMNFFLIIFNHINYIIFLCLAFIGLYIVISAPHMVKKVIGLNIFQSSIVFFYISMAKVIGGTAPILSEDFIVYSNPVPQVLMLTAIVVGVATSSVAFALCILIRKEFKTISEDDMIKSWKTKFLKDNDIV